MCSKILAKKKAGDISHLAICRGCRQGLPRNGFKKWLLENPVCQKTILTSGGFHAGLVAPSPSVVGVKVGRSDLHRTHALVNHRGLWWCTGCGAYTSAAPGSKASPKKLRQPCNAFKSRGARAFLRRLAKGFTPRLNMAWPLGLGASDVEAFKPVPLCRLRSKTTLAFAVGEVGSPVDPPLNAGVLEGQGEPFSDDEGGFEDVWAGAGLDDPY